MAVRQLSVLIDNKPGMLCKVTKLLADLKVDMKALSIADAADYGIMRILAANVEEVQSALTEEAFISKVNHVLAVSIDDTPGGLSKVIALLGENEINIEYLYAFVLPNHDNACMVLRVKDNGRAEKILNENNICLLTEDDIWSI